MVRIIVEEKPTVTRPAPAGKNTQRGNWSVIIVTYPISYLEMILNTFQGPQE